MKDIFKNFDAKKGLGIASVLLSVGGLIVNSLSHENEMKNLKADVEKDILEKLSKKES